MFCGDDRVLATDQEYLQVFQILFTLLKFTLLHGYPPSVAYHVPHFPLRSLQRATLTVLTARNS